MRVFEPGDGTSTEQPPPAPPVSVPPPAPPVGILPPGVTADSGGVRNVNGETQAEAIAAIYAEVAAGALPSVAIARHPIPPPWTTAQALNFLASLPQSTQTFGGDDGVITGPPVDTLPGFIPYDDADFPDDEGEAATDDELAEWDDYIDLLEDTLGAPV